VPLISHGTKGYTYVCMCVSYRVGLIGVCHIKEVGLIGVCHIKEVGLIGVSNIE
jgi:hypothetical protein